METYPVDIDPGQVVRWIRAERKIAPAIFEISATWANEVKEIPARKEYHLGDEEHEDLSEVASIATLEVAPAHASDGWLLKIVVENEAAPGVTEGAAAIEGERQIGLETFYRKFIAPGAGTANVTVDAEDSNAKARVDDLLDRIERNYHGSISARS